MPVNPDSIPADFRPAFEIIEKENIYRGSLIPILQKIQAHYGYLPREILIILSRRLGIPLSSILGAATFYSQFRFKPRGKHIIKVCHGTACHLAGATKLSDVLREELKIDSENTTSDGLFTMERVACLGCCSLAPVMMVDETTYGRLTPVKIKKILASYKKNERGT